MPSKANRLFGRLILEKARIVSIADIVVLVIVDVMEVVLCDLATVAVDGLELDVTAISRVSFGWCGLSGWVDSQNEGRVWWDKTWEALGAVAEVSVIQSQKRFELAWQC